jgi:hypothetical protein
MSTLSTESPAALLGFAALAVFLFLSSWYAWSRQRAAWKTFAARHDWSLTSSWGDLELQGSYNERRLGLHTEKRTGTEDHTGARKKVRNYTVVRLDLRDVLPPKLTLKTEGLGYRAFDWLGSRDEELGDPELDAALDLQRVTPRVRDLLLAPGVREQLLALRDQSLGFFIENGILVVEHLGVPGTTDALEGLVGPVMDLGDALDTARRTPGRRARG